MMAKFRSTAEMKLKLVLTVVAMMAIILFLPCASKAFLEYEKVITKFGISEKILERSKRFSDINSR